MKPSAVGGEDVKWKNPIVVGKRSDPGGTPNMNSVLATNICIELP